MERFVLGGVLGVSTGILVTMLSLDKLDHVKKYEALEHIATSKDTEFVRLARDTLSCRLEPDGVEASDRATSNLLSWMFHHDMLPPYHDRWKPSFTALTGVEVMSKKLEPIEDFDDYDNWSTFQDLVFYSNSSQLYTIVYENDHCIFGMKPLKWK